MIENWVRAILFKTEFDLVWSKSRLKCKEDTFVLLKYSRVCNLTTRLSLLLQIELEAIYHLNPDLMQSSVIPQVFVIFFLFNGILVCILVTGNTTACFAYRRTELCQCVNIHCECSEIMVLTYLLMLTL